MTIMFGNLVVYLSENMGQQEGVEQHSNPGSTAAVNQASYILSPRSLFVLEEENIIVTK